MRLTIRITLALTGIYIVAFQIYPPIMCRPYNKFWKPFERRKVCGADIIYWIFNSAVYGYSLVLDLILLILPIFPVLKLRLSLQKRLGAVAMFALGASACVAATYKLAVFGLQWGRIGSIDPRWATQQLSRVIPPRFDRYGYTMWIPTQAEISAAMIGSSLVALKPFLQRSLTRLNNALGTFMSSLSSQGAKGSVPSEGGSGLQPSDRSMDRYVKMPEESRTTLTSEMELAQTRIRP